MSSGEGQPRKPRAPACPVCGAPAAAASRPFCSRDCANADLIAWLDGRYVIAAPEDDKSSAGGSEDEGA